MDELTLALVSIIIGSVTGVIASYISYTYQHNMDKKTEEDRWKRDQIFFLYSDSITNLIAKAYKEALVSLYKLLVFYPNQGSEDYFDLVNLTSALHGKKLGKLGKDMLLELINEMFRVDPRLHGEVTNIQFSSYYWNAKAKFWANKNLFEKSLPLFERAIAFYPTNCEALYGKGLALANLRRYKEAIESYDIVINLDNRNKKAWCQKGCALNSEGNYSDSIDCFNHAISIDPLYLDAWYNKGNALFYLKKLIEALECYNKVINIDSDHFDAWKNMGSTLHMLEKFEEAIVCFERAIRIKPNERITGKVWFEKNEVLRKLGMDVEAEEAWEMALECDETLGVSG